MLRRTRYTLPVLAGVAAMLGGLLPGLWVVVAVVMMIVGFVVDNTITRVEEIRLSRVADRVIDFASDEQRPEPLTMQGGQEWQRLVGALNEVADVLRERFEALRSERARQEQLLDVIPTAVLLFGPRGLVYANPNAIELFDLEGAESQRGSAGQRGSEGLSPVRALGVVALHQAVGEADETGQEVTVTARRAGRELMARATRVGDDQIALIVTDLTSTTRLDDMRRDFVANASHELKTPVTGIQALADSLGMAMERDPDRAHSMVASIQTEATRLAQLVRELLDLARLEEGPDGRTAERVDVRRLCAGQIERLQVVAAQKEIAVSLTNGPDVGVVGVLEDMKLIVGNLLFNGIQYNQPGGTVGVSVRRRAGFVTIEVLDTGIGIPEADQDRIFERFYRVDKARSRAAGGTGLGLSLVRNAVLRHAGTVQVSSVLGEGSSFTVQIPVDGGTA